ncbi:hypothetical protein FJO69_00195 [[Mycoplasma] falconis]|uniref:Uncharacterized protein n=1 Tax=[Mycoplasma] falconis TaxID=92403 RepID=A0A501XCD5_9BACT|nr:hypothetical protein [[Mycoplasma] falconis]TPE58023.1 hypothetical protein FJO69_00195 [[Mycoplasma] falconis]
MSKKGKVFLSLMGGSLVTAIPLTCVISCESEKEKQIKIANELKAEIMPLITTLEGKDLSAENKEVVNQFKTTLSTTLDDKKVEQLKSLVEEFKQIKIQVKDLINSTPDKKNDDDPKDLDSNSKVEDPKKQDEPNQNSDIKPTGDND